jgi:hypothetical protein
VYASGDKILVSVNFNKNDKTSAVKSGSKPGESGAGGRKKLKVPPNAKPSVIIDMLDEEGPYKIIEAPVELLTIGESDNDDEGDDVAKDVCAPAENDAGMEPPPASPRQAHSPHVAADGDDEARSLAEGRPRTPSPPPPDSAVTGPPTMLPTPSKGPMTPPEEPPLDNSNSYDPFEPTDSPEPEEMGTTSANGGLPMSPPLAPVTPPLQPETPPLMMSPVAAVAAPPPPPLPLMLLPQRPPSPPVATVIPFLSSSSSPLKTPEPLEKFSYIR